LIDTNRREALLASTLSQLLLEMAVIASDSRWRRSAKVGLIRGPLTGLRAKIRSRGWRRVEPTLLQKAWVLGTSAVGCDGDVATVVAGGQTGGVDTDDRCGAGNGRVGQRTAATWVHFQPISAARGGDGGRGRPGARRSGDDELLLGDRRRTGAQLKGEGECGRNS
jgi:hypothetical protein